MSTNNTVSAFQFFCTVFACRIIALFTFVITDPAEFPAGDRSVVFIPFLLTGLVCCVPLLITVGRQGGNTLFTHTARLSPAVSRIAAVLYAAGAVWSACVSLTRFELFMSTVMYSGAALFELILLLAAGAVWIADKGIETTVRMSVIVLALIAASLLYVFLTTAKDFDTANLEPPLQNGVPQLIKNGFSAVARTGEPAALLVLAPHTRGNLKKGAVLWFAAFGITGSVLYTLISGVTGAYGERQAFQLYALTVLSKLGVVERLDALICAIWVLCSLVRLAFHLQVAGLFIEEGFRIKMKPAGYAGLCAPVIAGYALLSGSVTAFSRVTGSGINELLFTLLLIVFPFAVLAAEKIKERIVRS